MSRPKRLAAYLKEYREYRWSSIMQMIRNSKAEPAKCSEDFRGRLVVITGATSGIGYHTAKKYASHGAELLCINRNEERSRVVCNEIEAEFGTRCSYEIADFGRMEDVHRVAGVLQDLDAPIEVLIHNAGTFVTRRELTADGIEKVFAVNHLSSFVLNYLLRDKLRGQGRARILLVNSEGHRFAVFGVRLDDLNWERRFYTGLRSYGSAKTAQLLTMMLFDEYFEGTGVTINAMHPGAVKTHAGRDNGPLYKWFKRNLLERNLQSPELSSEALYYLGVSQDLEGVGGRFFNLTTEEVPAPPARDRQTAKELWDISLRLGGLGG